MLKIESQTTAGAVTIQLEGELIGPWVDELERCCEPILNTGCRIRMDLAGVSFVSREGLALLRSLEDRQVEMTNCTGFVAEQWRAQWA